MRWWRNWWQTEGEWTDFGRLQRKGRGRQTEVAPAGTPPRGGWLADDAREPCHEARGTSGAQTASGERSDTKPSRSAGMRAKLDGTQKNPPEDVLANLKTGGRKP